MLSKENKRKINTTSSLEVQKFFSYTGDNLKSHRDYITTYTDSDHIDYSSEGFLIGLWSTKDLGDWFFQNDLKLHHWYNKFFHCFLFFCISSSFH